MTAGKTIALFVAVFLVALLSLFPMRVALAWFGAGSVVSARTVSGSVWNSHWEDARLGVLALGDADARLDPSFLWTGAGRFHIDSPLSRLTLVRGPATGVENATLNLDSTQLRLPIPTRGAVTLADVTLLFDGARCASASGRIASDMFQVEWGGPMLSGDLACDGDRAVAVLTGETDGMAVDMRLYLAADGHYELRTGIAGVAPPLQDILTRAGFSGDGESLSRLDEGVLGW